MPTRVLYLQPAAAFGGAERQAALAMRLLPSHGVDVVPVVGPGREIVAFLEDSGVGDFLFRDDLPFDPKAPRSLRERARLWAHYAAAWRRLGGELAEVARDRRCDLIYASRPFAWAVAGEAGRRARLPVVWRAGTQFEHWLQPSLLGLLARRFPPRAIVYTSRAVEETIAPYVPAPGYVIHNGVDVTRFAAGTGTETETGTGAATGTGTGLRAELGIDPRTLVVAYVGRISPEKGTRLLLALCAALPSVTVLVAGDSGWRPRFEAELVAAGLDGRVRLLGFVRRIERLYAAADVVISPSVAEGCPNAVLEAMAMGRAVVATAVGGTREIIRDGEDGLLVDPDDVPTFAAVVRALLAAPLLRARLGEAAALRVRRSFSASDQVRRLAALLASVARDDRRASETAIAEATAP